MKIDCCPEPVAGPVVTARELSLAWTALGPLACRPWPRPNALSPQHQHRTFAALEEVLAGLYLVVDADGRLRWLGKAHRDGGVVQRLREHLAHPERVRVFDYVYVIAVDPFSPARAIAAAEGKAADLLGVRGRMGPRTWPSSRGWLHLITARHLVDHHRESTTAGSRDVGAT